MDVKEAVDAAKRYVVDLFLEERPSNIGLEEVVFDDDTNVWLVTVGFSRPWDEQRLFASANPIPRTYKTIEINNDSGKVSAIRSREFS